MSKMKVGLLTLAMLSVLGAGGAAAGGDELRRTVSINDRIPTASEVQEALFPKAIADQKTECAKLEKAGLRCQSVIPKSSLDSVQVTFARGSARLTDEAKVFLRSVGEALKAKESEWTLLTVEGHADATGSDAVNRRLSKERADSVKQFFASSYGLKNIETVGRGSDKLKDPEDSGGAVNRRIEFIPDW